MCCPPYEIRLSFSFSLKANNAPTSTQSFLQKRNTHSTLASPFPTAPSSPVQKPLPQQKSASPAMEYIPVTPNRTPKNPSVNHETAVHQRFPNMPSGFGQFSNQLQHENRQHTGVGGSAPTATTAMPARSVAVSSAIQAVCDAIIQRMHPRLGNNSNLQSINKTRQLLIDYLTLQISASSFVESLCVTPWHATGPLKSREALELNRSPFRAVGERKKIVGFIVNQVSSELHDEQLCAALSQAWSDKIAKDSHFSVEGGPIVPAAASTSRSVSWLDGEPITTVSKTWNRVHQSSPSLLRSTAAFPSISSSTAHNVQHKKSGTPNTSKFSSRVKQSQNQPNSLLVRSDDFPSLPTTKKVSVFSMGTAKKPQKNVWQSPSYAAENGDSFLHNNDAEVSQTDNNHAKKKGKQVVLKYG